MTERLIVIGRSGSGKSYMLDAMTKAESWTYSVYIDSQDAYPEATEYSLEKLAKQKHIRIRVDKDFTMDEFYPKFLDGLKQMRAKGFRDDVLLVCEEAALWVPHQNSNSTWFNDVMLRSRRYHSVACVFHHLRQVPPTAASSATKWIVFPLSYNKKDKNYMEEHLPELEPYIEELHKPENEFHFLLFDVKSRHVSLMTPISIDGGEDPEDPEDGGEDPEDPEDDESENKE